MSKQQPIYLEESDEVPLGKPTLGKPTAFIVFG